MEVAIGRNELERESATLVEVVVWIEEVVVVVSGRLEDGISVEVGELAGMIEDEGGGAACTGLDEFPLHTTLQEPWDNAFSMLSHT